jgi:outer membrane protein assembly factor BamB
LIALTIFFYASVSQGEDWPMWRYDAGRTASTNQTLAKELHTQWVLHLPPSQPAWPKVQYKLQFDASYEPIVKGHTLFVPSMVSDRVTAYDTRTGEEQWRFYTEGPVRFAPVAYQDKLYFICDDGYLYCLQSESGTLIRKFRGGPADRLVLGNDRLINMWPARGGPVLYDDKIYFAASIWPFMGIFLYALDAATGEVVWENSGTGSQFIQQQHGSPAFAGVAPQGYFAATENRLLVSGGRTLPCVYDRKDGKFSYYHLSSRHFHKSSGGYNVSAVGKYFFNRNEIFKLSDGHGVAAEPADVMRNDEVIGVDKTGVIRAYQLTPKPKGIWKTPAQSKIRTIHIRAGNQIFGSRAGGNLASFDLPEKNNPLQLSWQHQIEGDVWNMLAADDRLFVVTVQGAIYCFGSEKKEKPKKYLSETRPLPRAEVGYQKQVQQVLEQSKIQDGYCLLLGLGEGQLLWELVRQTNFQLIVLESDAAKVETFRRRLDETGLYGRRVALLTGDIITRTLPPYFANVILIEDAAAAGFAENNRFAQKVFASLRPYGGAAYLFAKPKEQIPLFKQVIRSHLSCSDLKVTPDSLQLTRCGALPDSADWTHQYGDIANTVCSMDKRVKAPLGVLWFGDRLDFTDVLPRHGHGPPEQVVAGRLFMEGINSLCVRDVYTGRVLWKKTLPKLNTFGIYYDKSYIPNFRNLSYNQLHLPGANVRGTNFVATESQVYILQKQDCLVLDAATGKKLQTLSLPNLSPEGPLDWGYIGVYKDYLIATAGFTKFTSAVQKELTKDEQDKALKKLGRWAPYYDKLAGQYLVVMNRHTGKTLWHRKAHHGWLHNAIIVGKDRLFCLDKPPPLVDQYLSSNFKINSRLFALDITSGKIQWDTNRDVFGSWLSYSELHDVLLQATRPSKDMLPEPTGRMMACRGADGKVLWDKPHKYAGPCMLHHQTIITQEKAFDLLTGEPKMRKHPLTGESVKWEYARHYGCNTVIASEHLLTFRSAAAGYFDLTRDGGTGNFGGFRSGCTSNLVAANGVLNAPDYTFTCTCSYQNQTSLALIHMPEVETWTFNKIDSSKKPVRQVGINLGAPGDRRAENGTLWLDYPSVGGKSPDISIKIVPGKPEYFRRHASFIQNNSLNWVAASGAKGLKQITIRLADKKSKNSKDGLVRIASDRDDAEESNSEVDLESSDLELVRDKGDQVIGLRFDPVHIPPGSNIAKAYVQFTVDETNSRETTLTIQGQATDQAETFDTTYKNVSSRPRTKAAISWKPSPWTKNGAAGQAQQTPDLSPVIQEIISRRGWKSGNALALIITGSGKRVADAYDGDKDAAPGLYIELENSPAPPPTNTQGRLFKVRLHFLEPDRTRKPGDRVFNVTLQGKPVLKNFDIVAAAGKANVGVIKEFNHIAVNDNLVSTLQPAANCPVPEPILCGIEILPEGW